MGNILLIVLYLICSVGGQVLFKMGANKGISVMVKEGFFNCEVNLMCIAGAISYVFSFLLFIFLLSKYNLSRINPILVGISYILSVMASVIILHEKVSVIHGIGISIIFVGVMVIVVGVK